MSALMWWSSTVRACMRWVMVGSVCWKSVMVGGGFSVWGSCIVGEVVWWLGCCRCLIFDGVDVAVCFVYGRVLGCSLRPWRFCLGVR